MMLAQIESSLERIAALRKGSGGDASLCGFKLPDILTALSKDVTQNREYREAAQQMVAEIKTDFHPASVDYLIEHRWPVALRVVLGLSEEAPLEEVTKTLVQAARRYKLKKRK